MNAVEVTNGYKFYGSSKNPKVVLNRVNVAVRQGSIYGLLGPSGCGKTTLLSSIVGVKSLNEGDIKVFGDKPSKYISKSSISRIGYMPQELALVKEFTIKEIIFYFGRIYGLSSEIIENRFGFLSKLLELPDEDRYVDNCSGGQQRCISFAVSMVHEPELLILDEPTVGLDPLLREKIWKFLIELTKSGSSTVIITTHYIEEAAQADYIGIMRDGNLLAQDTPNSILEKLGVTSLEEAFIQICMSFEISGEVKSGKDANRLTDITWNSGPPGLSYVENDRPRRKKSSKLMFTSKRRMKALLSKNIITMMRNPGALLFVFVAPLLQLISFYMAIGGNPVGLSLGIVNEELNSYQDCLNNSLITVERHEDSCDYHKLSCRFLHHLNDSVAIKEYYSSIEEAFEDARRAKTNGVIHFSSNFTASMADLHENGTSADNSSFIFGEIAIHLDKTNQQLTFFLERKLLQTYTEFSEKLFGDCGYPIRTGNVPIDFKPIYGSLDDKFTNFMAPGVIMTVIFFSATMLTSTIFISDRLASIWDRSIVAGVSVIEMLTAHIITQSTIVLIQVFAAICLVTFFFEVQNKGDDLTVIVLLMLLGFSGMMFGLFISIFCDSLSAANFVASGTFFPMIMLCGIVWPLEGMPTLLKYFALIMPFTIPSISARDILTKGWDFSYQSVVFGYGVTLAWIFIFILLCLILLKIKK